MRSGKSSVLHLITREAADEETRELDKEKDKWKQRAEEAEKKLKIKDEKITEMQGTGMYLAETYDFYSFNHSL